MPPMQSSPIELQRHLKAIDYPCNKDEVIATARSQGAPKEVMADLEQLPEQEYGSPTDITHALGSSSD